MNLPLLPRCDLRYPPADWAGWIRAMNQDAAIGRAELSGGEVFVMSVAEANEKT